MSWKLSLAATCLIASLTSGSSGPSQADQQSANQSSHPEATQNHLKFKLTIMSNGVTRTGAGFAGKTYKTDSGADLFFSNVYLHSREEAKKEYDDWISRAITILSQEKVEDGRGKEPSTMEYRAVATFASRTNECKEWTTILITAGNNLYAIQSTSPEAAFEFERWVKRTAHK